MSIDTYKTLQHVWVQHRDSGEGEAISEATRLFKRVIDWNIKTEAICEEVHKAYCKYHKERTGKEYWTKGDYSLLKEEGKEYDRRTVNVVLKAIKQYLNEA